VNGATTDGDITERAVTPGAVVPGDVIATGPTSLFVNGKALGNI
jgi:hypothetical protein